jgi:DNA-binding transcriptional LysR family regulator
MHGALDVRRLHYFVAVAEELHFTRAAARVHIAQPALSQQIRALEQDLGVQLCTRTSRSVRLTDAGRVLLDHAYRVLAEVDRAQQAVQRAEQGDLGRLVIGVMPEYGSELLSDLLGSYHRRHPDVNLVLQELRVQQQVDALIEGQLQVGLLTVRVEHPRIRLTPLERQRLLIALPATHRLARRRSLRLAELASERWLNPPAYIGPFYTACVKEGFEPIFTEQASDHSSQLALVAAGIGVRFVLESGSRIPNRHVVYRPLHPRLHVELLAAQRNDQSSPLIDGLLNVARSRRKLADESF